MNEEQEQRMRIVIAAKERMNLNHIPEYYSLVMRALDMYVCEPVWKKQIKFWRFVATMEIVVILILWGWGLR